MQILIANNQLCRELLFLTSFIACTDDGDQAALKTLRD